MDKTVYQSERLYVKMDGKYRHVTTPQVFNKMGLDWEWKRRKFIRDEELLKNQGLPIEDWPEGNPNGNGHKTDKLYKMLYVCPWYTKYTGFGGLDEIKEVGFNTYHTYSPFQWEQKKYWDTPEGRADCLKQVREMLEELKKREMYGCLQMPLRDDNLKDMTTAMKDFDNGIAGTVEEPDMTIPPNPTLEDQKRIYDTIKSIAPNMQVWGCFNGGQWDKTMNIEAYDVIATDSYWYSLRDGSHPVPGTLAAQNNNVSLPWWTGSLWLTERKFPMMEKILPKNMPVINIQQGFYGSSQGLPNIEEEWNLYHKEFGLNSIGMYPYGLESNQAVMTDNRGDEFNGKKYGINAQCREFMKKLDEKEVR